MHCFMPAAMEVNTLVLRDRVDSKASWPMAREMSARTDFLTIFFFTVRESGVGSRKKMATGAREGDDIPKQLGLLMAVAAAVALKRAGAAWKRLRRMVWLVSGQEMSSGV